MEFWRISLYRIRALCIEIHGYDPEMENWDQSPFHMNEVGSQGGRTLVIKGAATCPLIEGHADTRHRWSLNATTFSNKQRILDGERPYAELCFKAEGGVLELRLRNYIRSCGYGPWLTVATSPKGSYR